MNFIAIGLGICTVLMFVFHALVFSYEKDTFFANSELTKTRISTNLAATASSLGTALLFILFQTPVYGVLIFLIILMYLLGQLWFSKIALKTKTENRRDIGSIYRLVKFGTKSRALARTTNLLSVFTFVTLLLVEVIIGAAILEYALPIGNFSSIIAVIFITLSVCVYVVIGGFDLVTSSDKWQFYFLLCGVLITILLFSTLIIQHDQSLISAFDVFLVPPEASGWVLATFVLNVLVVNSLLPLSQSLSWQRFASAKDNTEFKAGYDKAIYGHIAVAWLAFVFLAVLFYQLNGDSPGGVVDMFSLIDSAGAIGVYFVGPILFAALVAAIISTADSLLNTTLLSIDDFFGDNKELEVDGDLHNINEKSHLKRRIISATLIFLTVVLGYIGFTFIGSGEKGIIVGLMFTAVGQTTLFAPIALYSAKQTQQENVSVLPAGTALFGIGLGFLVLWGLSIYGLRTGNLIYIQVAPVIGILPVLIGLMFSKKKILGT